MRESRILRGLDLFRGAFEKAGVDYPIMRSILQVKLTMDGRRVPTIIAGSAKRQASESNQPEGNAFLRSLWVYGLMGLILVMFMMMPSNYIFQMSLVFGILMFLVMTSMISDFSSVLLDIRDKTILYTKPVNRKTLSMAKLIHILIYMFFVTGALAGPSLLVGLVKYGVGFFLIYLADIILMDILIVVLTAALYLVVLKFFDGERLKDVINYVQIGLSIGITVGYQLISRLFNYVNFEAQFHPKWWQFIVFPVWFAGPFELLLRGDSRSYFVVFTLLAVLVPILLLFVYIKMMPAFERNLQKLSDQSVRSRKAGGKVTDMLAKWFSRTREEQIFFRFAVKMMSTERDFKLRVYPTLGFSIIFPFIFFFTFTPEGGTQAIPSSKMYLFIYFCALLIPTVVMTLRYSGKYKGAWIYKTAPISNTAPIFKGTLKAFLARLVLPMFLVDSIIFIAVFGVRILPDLVDVLLMLPLYTLISFMIFRKALPFSEAFETTQQKEAMLTIPLMGLLGVFAGVHYYSTTIPYGVYIYMALLVVLNVVGWRWVFQKSLK
ncbi:hypothetical protein [Paenibacillus sp. J22TS3]|uniref:hypothetical protein n=1 Tax=Paenibacillus sp. J22TS3 TaxID=2807192 RepID=UPI001B2E4D6A|nr:hypothetical protein [Paenibacillus sp. J22TS3]GIP21957.1 hypothetical protein J22TS3_22320 [Paenibacillus sp. J22TS3]